MPKVSVIIPCYNQGRYIDEAVDSVLAQTFQDFEIIIINDGSTDEFTNEKLQNYIKPKTKVVHIENQGPSGARNAGLKLSNGKYIQFLDGDDLIHKTKFEEQITQLENIDGYALSYSDYFTSSEFNIEEFFPSRYINPKFQSSDYLKEIILNWEIELSIPCHCFLFNSSMFFENNIFFDEELPNHEDWDCWVNIFKLKPKVFYIDKKLAIYRIRSKAMCSDVTLMNEGYLLAIKKQLIKQKGNKPIYLLLKKKLNGISSNTKRNESVIKSWNFLHRTKKSLKILVKNYFNY